jgi:Na+/H+ antiporter NhaC
MGPQAEGLLPLAVAAVVSGGVFGDHASPISDTTIIAAMAAGCDLIAHVKTQLPWALLAAFLALLAFLLAGYFAL